MLFDIEKSVTDSASSVSDLASPPPHLLDALFLENILEEQQNLRTPVTLFSEAYDSASPAKRFSHLIPLSKPQAGEQYSFEVNLDACTGCKACVTACHSLNGLDENESWRDMGLLTGTLKKPYLQTVTTACHHCADPACMNGCPVLAYDKDSVTGIVRHLDDQCIGCSYCILKCPYDVPKFNLKRGIVRKCDMCQGRLAEGEAPACVQACPNEAIKIVAVKISDLPPRGQIIAGAFDSSYTRPTTRYISRKEIPPHVHPADAGSLTLDHAHTPLSWMLVLTQMSAGAFIGCTMALWTNFISLDEAGITSAAALFMGIIGINLSVLHLGQPLKAWRAFMGWRKSWLSREILAFGALPAGGAAIMAAWWLGQFDWLRLAVTGTAIAAVTAVFCSVMVYVDTRRPYWSLPLTAGKFIGTQFMLGSALCAATWSWLGSSCTVGTWVISLAFLWGITGWELISYWQALKKESSPWHRSARIMQKHLKRSLQYRALLVLMAGAVIPLLITLGTSQTWLLTLSALFIFTSQLVERLYFFTAAAGPKMPGN